jgi:hypothetical protein
MMGDTTQELVPNQERDQRKMMQAQAKQINQVVANQAKQVPKCQTNQIHQGNEELGNKEGVN